MLQPHTKPCRHNNNNKKKKKKKKKNTWDNVYGAMSSWHKSLQEFTRFIWRMQASARRLPTLRPGQYKTTLHISNMLSLCYIGVEVVNNIYETTEATSTKQSTTLKPTTTTTISSGSTPSSRCHDTNVRRWLQTALHQSEHLINSGRQRPPRSHHAVLNHRPSSAVLDAIRAIEARQVPPAGPAALPTRQNANYRSTVRWPVDVLRRPAYLELAGGPAQAARLIQPAASLHINALCQQSQIRSQDLPQGHFEGQFKQINYQSSSSSSCSFIKTMTKRVVTITR